MTGLLLSVQKSFSSRFSCFSSFLSSSASIPNSSCSFSSSSFSLLRYSSLFPAKTLWRTDQRRSIQVATGKTLKERHLKPYPHAPTHRGKESDPIFLWVAGLHRTSYHRWNWTSFFVGRFEERLKLALPLEMKVHNIRYSWKEGGALLEVDPTSPMFVKHMLPGIANFTHLPHSIHQTQAHLPHPSHLPLPLTIPPAVEEKDVVLGLSSSSSPSSSSSNEEERRRRTEEEEEHRKEKTEGEKETKRQIQHLIQQHHHHPLQHLLQLNEEQLQRFLEELRDVLSTSLRRRRLRVGVVRGTPWMEDLTQRWVSNRVIVSFRQMNLQQSIAPDESLPPLDDLYTLFRPYGKLNDVIYNSNSSLNLETNGTSAVIFFKRPEDAAFAKNCLHGVQLPNQDLQIRICYERFAPISAIKEAFMKVRNPQIYSLLCSF
jgi:hypothetical protein